MLRGYVCKSGISNKNPENIDGKLIPRAPANRNLYNDPPLYSSYRYESFIGEKKWMQKQLKSKMEYTG